MAERTVTGVIKYANGRPWAGGIVYFVLEDDAYTTSPAETFPKSTVTAIAGTDGSFSANLVGGLSTRYRVTLPDLESFTIVVEDGAATTLEALRAATEGLASPLTSIESIINGLIAAGVGVVTIQSNDATVRADPDVIDFSPDFALTESPAGEVNVALVVTPQPADADLTAFAAIAWQQGDILYYNGTTLVRLPKGTALQRLRMNAAATAPEWVTVDPTAIDFGTLTIAGDAVTLPAIATGTLHGVLIVDTEGAAATDNLTNINGTGTIPLGFELRVQQAASARDVTFVHATGNLRNGGAVNVPMATAFDSVTYFWLGTVWREIARSL